MKITNWPGMLGFLGTWAQKRLDDLKTTELAMYAYDEGTGVDRRSRLLVAAELGLLDVVEAVAEPEEAGPGPDVWKITGDLHPWSVVRGARLSYSQTGERQAPQLHVSLEHPEFEQVMTWADDNPLRIALQEFGVTCIRQALPPNSTPQFRTLVVLARRRERSRNTRSRWVQNGQRTPRIVRERAAAVRSCSGP